MLFAHSLFHFGYGSNHHKSKGTLLTPPVRLPCKKSDSWKIAFLQITESNKIMRDVLTKRLQALGKDQTRVQLYWLLPANTQDSKQSNTPQPQWRRQEVPAHIWTQLIMQKSKHQQPCVQFILDPENQAILCYDHNNLPRDIDLDLRKLLKWSR